MCVSQVCYVSGEVCNSGVLCDVCHVCYVPSLVCFVASQVFYMSSQQVLYVSQARLVNQVCYVLSHFCKLGALCVNLRV